MDIERFRELVLGKVYRYPYNDSERYLVVDVLGRRHSSEVEVNPITVSIIYIHVSKPVKKSMSFLYDNIDTVFEIKTVSKDLPRSDRLPESKYKEVINESAQDIYDYFKTVCGDVVGLLENVGVKTK